MKAFAEAYKEQAIFLVIYTREAHPAFEKQTAKDAGWKVLDGVVFHQPKTYAERRKLAESIVTTDRPDIPVIAAKPASRGEGIIARLSTLTSPDTDVMVTVRDRAIKAAFLCDARERDLDALTVQSGSACLKMPGNLATVRLLL